LLAHGRCFSPDTPVSSTTKTGRHDIAEILLKVALNTKNKKNQPMIGLVKIMSLKWPSAMVKVYIVALWEIHYHLSEKH